MSTVPNFRRREGAVLAAVLILALLLGILAVGVLRIDNYVGIEAANQGSDAKAFWAAEAGLERVKARLRVDPAYRANPSGTLSDAVLGYNVNVVGTGGGGSNFTVVSTGMVQSAVRVLRQDLVVRPFWSAFEYAMFCGGGLMWLRKDTTIEGFLISAGDLYSEGGYKFNGAVNMVDGHIYDGDPSPDYPEPDPKPTVPVLTNTYNQIVQTASSGTNVAPTFPLNLGGRTNRYNLTSLTLTGPIQGPGTLVVKGDITISTTIAVGPSVNILAGGRLYINAGVANGADCVLYATQGINIDKDDAFSTNSCAMITPGDIWSKKALTFSGLIYAGGDITCDKDVTLTGCAACGGAMTMKMGLDMMYDLNQFEEFLPRSFNSELRVVNTQWREVVP